MSSVSSEIKGSGPYTLHVEGINVNTFESIEINEFRKERSLQGRSISSFELYLDSDYVDGGEISAENKNDLEEFREFLLKIRGYELRDDL